MAGFEQGAGYRELQETFGLSKMSICRRLQEGRKACSMVCKFKLHTNCQTPRQMALTLQCLCRSPALQGLSRVTTLLYLV
tara:strand:+ start:1021 stop:1260 length:240 start_codon:yes stop_codon:yes gene_type:complete